MEISSIIGYCGSLLIAVSLMMDRAVRLRLVNFFGAVFFTIYGISIDAVPVYILNSIIAGADAYYIWKYKNRKEFFSLLRLNSDSEYVQFFLKFYGDDIAGLFPGYSYRFNRKSRVICLLRNAIPSGLFIYEERAGGINFIVLDYVIPRYRDFKSGYFLFNSSVDFFKNEGAREFRSFVYGKKHLKYLTKMAFERCRVNIDGDVYRRRIDV